LKGAKIPNKNIVRYVRVIVFLNILVFIF